MLFLIHLTVNAQTESTLSEINDSKTLLRQQKALEKKRAKELKQEEKQRKREEKKARIDTRKSETYATSVYLFSVSSQFGDSVVYITTLQEVDSALLTKKYDYLSFRSAYSKQFNDYISTAYAAQNQVTSVFYDKNRKKALRRFNKVMKRYEENHDLVLRMVTDDQFHFSVERY